jgi:MFS family permease
VRKLLSDRRIRLFYLGNAVSSLGDDALFLALAVWVRILTGSTALASLDMFAVAAGSLFAPLTGIVVDRVRRKPLMIWTYLLTAALLMSLLLVHSRQQFWLIFTVTFLYGMSGTFSNGAQNALIQKIVPAELLAEANGLEQVLSLGMRLVTPAFGVGLLVWLGGHAVAVMDAATFLVAVACLLFVRVEETGPRPEAERRHWAADITTGVRYLAHSAVLRQLTLAFAAVFLVFGLQVPLLFQAITVGLHRPASWMAVLITAQGVGGIAGGVLAGPTAKRIGDGMLVVVALAAVGVLCVALASPDDLVILPAIALFGFFLAWLFVGVNTIFQKRTPNELMGRVNGVVELAVQVPQAAGNVLGAVLISVLFYRDLCYLTGIFVLLVTVCLGTRPQQRRAAPAADPGAGAEAESAAAAVEIDPVSLAG